MTGPATLLQAASDLLLMLIVAAWLQEFWRPQGSSARLELFACSVLQIAASATLWNAVAGSEELWQQWPQHALVAAGCIVFGAVLKVSIKASAAEPALLHRSGRYLAGIGFSGALLAVIVGQYALTA